MSSFGAADFRYQRYVRTGQQPSTVDRRTSGEHDRDRLLYCQHLLRLSSLTQVLGVHERQVFHNRLTHTLKVAQIGRRLAQRLLERAEESSVETLGGVDPDVVEAVCLAHDLGHPPFGHVAEKALNDLPSMKAVGGYEANAQSFRIVSKLAFRRTSEPGLNLTRATLAGILKYPWYSGEAPPDAEAAKFGSYRSERAIFDFAREGSPAKQPTLEARIMEWADDITYAVHDLEDFFRAGLTPLDRLTREGLETKAYINETARYVQSQGKDPERFEQAFVEILKGFPREPYGGSIEERIFLNGMSSGMITFFIDAPQVDNGKWVIDDAVWYQMAALKRLTWHFVITGPGLATLQRGQVELITQLHYKLDKWVEDSWQKPDEQRRLPAALRYALADALRDAEARKEGFDDTALRLRAVTDFIVSLTEDQAIALYQRLIGGTALSAFEPWLHN